ncbi:MAG: hypothetical protein J2P43_16255 [Candidatus Dormibacteraeota bacterium]|nr:hypothetical protein [Candidatus Dormibacteraeota bacterium]
MASSHRGDRLRALRGWVARLVGGKDRYGVVLVLIIVLIVVLASGQDQVWTRPGGLGLVSAVLLYTLVTSGARRRLIVFVLVALALVFALSILEAAVYGTSVPGLADLFMLLLVVITQVVIARRVVTHPVIEFNTIAGALCIYLLVGFCFATIFRLIPAFGGGPFFTTPHAGTLDYLWFSYVTQTTVGYGDLIPRTGLGKMLAVTEALLGQIYLVTIVALLVGNIGRPRRRGRLREHPEPANTRRRRPPTRTRPRRRRRTPLRP